ncbi:MAG: TonB-dependent receptor [Bryobacteraceae bacterium]
MIRFIAVLLLFVTVGFAQIANEGAVLGVVTDSTGAAVAGAQVTVENLDTRFTKVVTTSAEGSFEVLALPIGPYTVSVSLQGFKTWKVARLVLNIGDRSRLSPVLEVGDVKEQVSVEATAELIQTEKASVEGLVEQKQIRDLPLNGRNPVQLVALAPGMQYNGQAGGQWGAERGSTVQGVGVQSGQTQFSLDGMNANGGMDEGAIAIPNVDTIAEFSVQQSTFSAEYGRDPMHVVMATKSGTNEFHGSLWEFMRNDKFAARNTFASGTPKLIQNQFGASAGGRIIRDKTFFFSSFEGLRIRTDTIFNSTVPQPAMLTGDFSKVSTSIIDPTTGKAFPGNIIPSDRIDPAAKFFLPYLLQPNSSDGRFHQIAPNSDDNTQGTLRVDHIINEKQRVFGRWVIYDSPFLFYGYSPKMYETNTTRQNSVGLNYVYTITPSTLFSISAGYQRSNNQFTSPNVGTTNLTQEAGIQGFDTPGRANAVGLPSANISGYAGFGTLWGVPGRLWMESWNGKSSLNLIRGKHSVVIGMEYDNRTTYGNHASFASRGTFNFNGQYTGDGFADYLLGLTSWAGRNYPLQTFGMQRSPYVATFVEDTFKVNQKLTLNLGLRYDRWLEKRAVRGNAATFDPKIGKAVAGVDKNGQVDLTAQPVAQYLAAATAGLWVSATEAHIPAGLFEATGYVSPRIGLAWRPFTHQDLVIRGGYGIFASSFQGNISASSIVGPPYWSYETLGFSALSNQKWETAFPAVPTAFIAPSIAAAAYDTKPQKTHEWNVSVQKSMPFRSALTLSYVGNHVFDGISGKSWDDVAPGAYTDLQAARPYPGFSGVTLYQNLGQSWYNGLQAKWERRFNNGLTFTGAYAYSRAMLKDMASCIYCGTQPFTPAGYLTGRSDLDRTHILTANAVYELPIGRGRKYLGTMNRAANLLIGGWEWSGVYSFSSGQPLSFDVPGATLGNGYDTRPDLVGDLNVSHPSAALWFNPAALAAPALYKYGNSGMNIFDGPASHNLDTALMKNFFFTEAKYVQFRWEMFNAFNNVNLGTPNTSIGQSTTGQIFWAGSARVMQFGLKVIF